MFHIYLDAEFDAIRMNGKFHQVVISLGAVLTDEQGVILDEFYSLVKPRKFKRLTNTVMRMTHLKNEMIHHAPDMYDVMLSFKQWIHNYTKDMEELTLYSFGPDDKRTLSKNNEDLKLDTEGLFMKMNDLQKALSAVVLYNGRLVSPTLSLDDLKGVFQIDGVVEHNALTDAKDLCDIHQAYLHGQVLDDDKIEEIVVRKIQKEIEVKQKQRIRMKKMMIERFDKYKRLAGEVIFYKDVLELLREWNDRDHSFQTIWKKEKVIVGKEDEFQYHELRLFMYIDMEGNDASVILLYQAHDKEVKKRYLLTYRNATMVEGILMRTSIKMQEMND